MKPDDITPCNCSNCKKNLPGDGAWAGDTLTDDGLEENVWMDGERTDDESPESGWMEGGMNESGPGLIGRRLTEMTLSWAGPGTLPSVPGLLAGVSMASVICNQMRFSELIFFCPPPPPTPCVGMHIAYDPANADDAKAVTQFLAVMKGCGMPATLTPATRNCCRSGKKHFKVNIPGAKPRVGMNRTAIMIRSPTRSFCLEINTGLPADVDLFTRAPNKEDSQFNPLNFTNPGYQSFKFSGTNTEYKRPPCDLLAHVVSENYYGNYQIKGKLVHLKYQPAHALAIAEENWVRVSRGEKAIELNDKNAMTAINAQKKRIETQEGKGKGKGKGVAAPGECKSASTVTCTNNCPGGRCCADPVTPAGWVSCKDICTPGSKGCPA